MNISRISRLVDCLTLLCLGGITHIGVVQFMDGNATNKAVRVFRPVSKNRVIGIYFQLFFMWMKMPRMKRAHSKRGNPIPHDALIFHKAIWDTFKICGMNIYFGPFATTNRRTAWFHFVTTDGDEIIIDMMPLAMPSGSFMSCPILVMKSQDPDWFNRYKPGEMTPQEEYVMFSPSYLLETRAINNEMIRALPNEEEWEAVQQEYSWLVTQPSYASA